MTFGVIVAIVAITLWRFGKAFLDTIDTIDAKVFGD
jgi:hypothetical protein